MAGPQQKVSVVLNGGFDERSASELAGPVAQQGASLTLRRSENTRLSTKPGTTTRAPLADPAAAFGNYFGFAGPELVSTISAEANKSSLLFLRRDVNRRLGVSSRSALPGAGAFGGHAGSAMIAHITGAGAEAGSTAQTRYSSTVVRAANGDLLLYHVYFMRTSPTTVDLQAYVTDTDGSLLITPRVILTIPAITTASVTSHNDDQATIWLNLGATREVYVLSGNTTANSFSLSGSTVLATGGPGLFEVRPGAYVGADGTLNVTYRRYAYMVEWTGGNTTARRIDTQAGYAVTTGTAVAGATGDYGTMALFFGPSEFGERLVVAVASPTTLTTQFYNPSLALLSSGTASVVPANTGLSVSISWDSLMSLSNAVVLLGEQATVSATARYATAVFTSPMSTVNLNRSQTVPGTTPVSHGAQVIFSDTEITPVFELAPYYGPLNSNLTEADYVPDPDTELWCYRGFLTAVARYGTLRGGSAPAATPSTNIRAATVGPIFVGSGRVWTSYPVRPDISGIGIQKTRRVLVDFSTLGVSRTLDRDGSAMTATALPLEWDGVCPAELGGPLQTPKVYYSVGGAGTWPTGTYSVAVVLTWIDGTGKKHRSAPGLISVNIPAGPSVLNLFVYAPSSNLRTGGITSSGYSYEIYTSTLTDPTLLRTTATTSIGVYGLTATSVGYGNGTAQIYSGGTAGEEQTPQPPPPLKDIAIIGDRAWGIDAEQPSRLVHSKRRVAGIGYEWYPGYEILLPSGAGAATAVREWQGAVAVFTERAIFIVSGDGPDNLVGNPSGGGFSKPQKVADLGCTNTNSVVASPAGILFQRDDEILLFAGGPPKPLMGPVVSGDIVGAAVLRDADEVVMFESRRQLVWNYSVGRWTTWNIQHTGDTFLGSLRAREVSTLAYNQNQIQILDARDESFAITDSLLLLDSGTPSTLPMVWETDWVILGGDFQDHVLLQHLVFSAKYMGQHGITIEIFTDYNESSATTSRSWTDAELLDLSPNGRYTLKVQATNRGTRAVKIRLTETTPDSAGMEPVALTLYYNIEANLMEPAIKPGAFR